MILYAIALSKTWQTQTCFWNNEILTPIQKNGMLGPGKIAFKKLKILLDRMMLRRTKVRPLFGVPKREFLTVCTVLDPTS
jgi:hypothetical protein